MNTLAAYEIGKVARARGDPQMVFDWDKAATIIKKKNVQDADAGLQSDYEYTRGTILRNGKPTDGDGCYLSSNWATPMLIIEDFQEIECWKYQKDTPGWASDTVWPESALKILEGKK